LEGRAGWWALFPNEKHEFLVGCTEDRRAVQQAAQMGSPAGCRKDQPSGPPYSAAKLNVQPAGLR